MGESEWILPLLGIGGLAIGGLLVLPNFMKKEEYIPRIKDPYMEDYEEPSRLPLVIGEPNDAYVITDEDFDKLDIGKKDRKFLNRQRKLRDAKLERVVYGDNRDMEVVPSYFVNTVSPYGQGPAPEFTRLVGPADLSNTNTRTNTINLY